MPKKISLLLAALLCSIFSFAQGDSSHLRISLLTCGTADNEIYEVFGHTAVRVVDSVAHTDMVYNYGTFEYGPDFEMKFMKGKLLYYVMAYPFKDFMQEYMEAARSVEEQVLLADWKQKERMYYFLQWNASPENKYYQYDHFYDNCATRIRDIFPRPEIFGHAFKYGQVLPQNSKLTFRDITNRYFYRDPWTRLGVNILFGRRTDKVMTSKDVMFLPDYLRDGLKGATVNGRLIATPPVQILAGATPQPAGPNLALALTCLVAVLTIAGLTVPRLRLLGRIMKATVLVVTGLLGVMILVMWFGTDHQCCKDNLNVLWCLPTNFIAALVKPTRARRYAIIALVLLLVSVILHMTGVQGLTIEMFPLLLSLLFIFGWTVRKG